MLQYPQMCRITFAFLLTMISFSAIHSQKLSHLHLVENLDTLKLLKGLTDFNSTTLCGQHVTELLSDLRFEKSWALLMFDSSGRTPSGFLKGNTIDLGQFDECLQIDHPGGNFTGKYCMLQVDPYLKTSEKELFPSPEDFDNKEYFENPDYIRLGFCVPSTCTADDIVEGLNLTFNHSKLDKIFSLTVQEEACKTKNSTKFEYIDWTALGPLLFFISLSILSTIYDVTNRKKGVEPDALFSAFSLYSNGKNLLHITKSSEQLKPLHGLRVLSTFWIVIHHASLDLNSGMDRIDSIKAKHDVQHIPLYYGFVAVDTFFFLSGMLTCVAFFRNIKKKGYYDVPLGYIHRYIRLTPSYAAMIFIIAHVYIHLGNGPIWYFYTTAITENCRRNWWTGILYIQNFVHSDTMCNMETWYLSADMQLHWLSPLLLYPVFFWPAFAKFTFVIVLVLAVCTSLAVAYSYNLGANFLNSTNPLQNDLDYFPFYSRAAPYIIGLGTGYFINKIRNEKTSIKLNKLQVLMGWLMSTGLCLATLYCSIPFAKFKTHSTLENVLYLSLHRASWGFGLSWIVFACLTGYGGPVNTFLSWDLFQPFSKLSYNVYLVHCSLMVYKLGTARATDYGGDIELVYDFFGYLALAHLLAIPLTLIFEMPFGNLDKYFFQDVKILPIPWSKKEQKEENCIGLSKMEPPKQDDVKQQTEIILTP